MTDDRMERLIGGLLRAGIMLAAGVTLIGGIHYLTENGGRPMSFHVFRGEPAELRRVAGVLEAIRQGRAEALIQLGLLLLVATPVARVAFSVVAYALERDWLYTGVTLLVLALLIASMTGLI